MGRDRRPGGAARFIPFVDIAYQGLGAGIEADAAGLRLLVARACRGRHRRLLFQEHGPVPRARRPGLMFVCRDEPSAQAAVSQALVAARGIYSMPPAHGRCWPAGCCPTRRWRSPGAPELATMCERINGLRRELRHQLATSSGRDFDFIERENGMFSSSA